MTTVLYLFWRPIAKNIPHVCQHIYNAAKTMLDILENFKKLVYTKNDNHKDEFIKNEIRHYNYNENNTKKQYHWDQFQS